MKETLQSLVRHLLTFLAGLGTTLHAAGLLGAEDVVQVNEQGLSLQNVIAGVIVAILMRLFLKFSGKLVSAHVNDGKNGGGALLLLLGVAGLLGLGLPSCSAPVMVRGSYEDRRGNVYSYDPVTGVAVKLTDVESAK